MKRIFLFATTAVVIFIILIFFITRQGTVVRIIPKTDLPLWDSPYPFEGRNQTGTLKAGQKYSVVQCELYDKNYLVISIRKGYFGKEYIFEGDYELERSSADTFNFEETAPSCQ
jgi:hypothetical protein